MPSKGLTAASYQGMTPEQIVQTRSLAQEDRRSSMNFAQAFAGLNIQRDQLTETKRSNEVREKMALINQEVNRQAQEQQMAFEKEREASIASLRSAQTDQAVMHTNAKMIEIENQEKMLDYLSRTQVQARELEEPISLLQAQYYQASGMKLTFGSDDILTPQDSVLQIDPETGGVFAAASYVDPMTGEISIRKAVEDGQPGGGISAPDDAAEDDRIIKAEAAAEGTFKTRFQTDMFGSLSPQEQVDFHNMTDIAHHLIRNEGYTGKAAANKAAKAVDDFNDNIKALSSLRIRNNRSRRANANQVVELMVNLLSPIIEYQGKVPSDVFPSSRIEAVLLSHGYTAANINELGKEAARKLANDRR